MKNNNNTKGMITNCDTFDGNKNVFTDFQSIYALVSCFVFNMRNWKIDAYSYIRFRIKYLPFHLLPIRENRIQLDST